MSTSRMLAKMAAADETEAAVRELLVAVSRLVAILSKPEARTGTATFQDGRVLHLQVTDGDVIAGVH